MFPSLQEIFRDSLHNRVSRRSPSHFRVSESLRKFPESLGVFLAARPSLREVSGQNRTLQESPSAPRVSQRPPAYKGFDFVDFLRTEGALVRLPETTFGSLQASLDPFHCRRSMNIDEVRNRNW